MDITQAEPVQFDCLGCNQPWFSPENQGCPRCGHGTPAEPDSRTWDLSYINGPSVYLTAHLRDPGRLEHVAQCGVRAVIDVAGDPDQNYIWRPNATEFEEHNILHVCIDDVSDDGVEIPHHAFDDARATMYLCWRLNRIPLIHCAAGLRRSPHILYGVLRDLGYDRNAAWSLIHGARPIVQYHQPYIDSAESWLETNDSEPILSLLS